MPAGEFSPSRWTTYPSLEIAPEIETTAISRETRGSDLSQMMSVISLLSSPEMKKSVFTIYMLLFRRQMQDLHLFI